MKRTIESATKKELVDFCAKYLTKSGKKCTKAEFSSRTAESLLNLVHKCDLDKHLEAELNTPVYKKYFVDSTRPEGELAYDNWEAVDEAALRKQFAKLHPDEEIVAIVEHKNNHRCKYCGEITPGKTKDLLCDDCHELFGHTRYSEL